MKFFSIIKLIIHFLICFIWFLDIPFEYKCSICFVLISNNILLSKED